LQMLKLNLTKKANDYHQDVYPQWNPDIDPRLTPALNSKLMEFDISRNWLAFWDGHANSDALTLPLKFPHYPLTLLYHEPDTCNRFITFLVI
jgi:hypothetical protein